MPPRTSTSSGTARKRRRCLAKHGGRSTGTVFIARPRTDKNAVAKNRRRQHQLTKRKLARFKAFQDARQRRRAAETSARIKNWKETCTTVRVPQKLVNLDKDTEDEMQRRFVLMQSNPNTIQYDLKGHNRIVDQRGKILAAVIADGIPAHIASAVHKYTQELACAFPDCKRGHEGDARHASTGNAHYYPVVASASERNELEANPDLNSKLQQQEKDIPGVEYAHEGVALLHTAHAWNELGKNPAEGGLVPSAQLLGSGSSHRFLDVKAYYRRSDSMTEIIRQTYKEIAPDFYGPMMKSFNAGKQWKDAIGPYLARALIYKLQVSVHLDKNDRGLSAMTNSGRYYGGYLYFPQFWMRIEYVPGTLVFLRADRIWHGVGEWTPKVYAPGDTCTPGRIAYVFFSHKDAHDTLFKQKENWLVDEAGGTFVQ